MNLISFYEDVIWSNIQTNEKGGGAECALVWIHGRKYELNGALKQHYLLN